MSENHRKAGYTYRVSQSEAARNRARLPALCSCGRMITPDMVYGVDWENGHDDSRGGVKGTGARGTVPQHVKCNRSAGGKMGAAITNAATKSRKRQRAW